MRDFMYAVGVVYSAVNLISIIIVCGMFIWTSIFWQPEDQPGDDVPLWRRRTRGHAHPDRDPRLVLVGIRRAQEHAIRQGQWDQRSIEQLMDARDIAYLDRHDIPRYMLLQPPRAVANIMLAVGLIETYDETPSDRCQPMTSIV